MKLVKPLIFSASLAALAAGTALADGTVSNRVDATGTPYRESEGGLPAVTEPQRAPESGSPTTGATARPSGEPSVRSAENTQRDETTSHRWHGTGTPYHDAEGGLPALTEPEGRHDGASPADSTRDQRKPQR